MEKELADKYAVDLGKESRFVSAFTGRGLPFKKVQVPLFPMRRGPIGGSVVACFFRHMGSRLNELAALTWMGQVHRTWQQTRKMHSIMRTLASIRPPDGHKAEWWYQWCGYVNYGLLHVDPWTLLQIARAARTTAASLEAAVSRGRSTRFRKWALSGKAGTTAEVEIFRWLRERPPFINAVIDINGDI